MLPTGARWSSFPLIMAGTVTLALAANTYELLCTAGFPMVYSRILTLNALSAESYYLYLLLYNLIYILPLLAIVILFTIKLGSRKLSEQEGMVLKLLSGVMMLMLGLLLVVEIVITVVDDRAIDPVLEIVDADADLEDAAEKIARSKCFDSGTSCSSENAVIVLDEATSNLDPETEVRVESALRALLAGRTSIVIAHRLSTIRDSHNIMVLNGGEIVEFGPHDELMDRKGFYFKLHQLQNGAAMANAGCRHACWPSRGWRSRC